VKEAYHEQTWYRGTICRLRPVPCRPVRRGGAASFSEKYVVENYAGVRVENGTARGATRYTDDISFEDEKLFGGLNGGGVINKPNELIAATAVLNIKEVAPVDALKVYAEITMEGAVKSFLGVTGTTHGQVLERLRGKYHFTDSQIAGAIHDTVAAVVDAEFSKIEFHVSTNTDGASAQLVRRDNQFFLYCEGNFGTPKTHQKREYSANSLEMLLTVIRNSGDFKAPKSVDTIRENALLMPSVSRVRGSKVASSELFTEILTGFYTAKTLEEQNRYYKALMGFDARLQSMILTGEGDSAKAITHSWGAVLYAINPEFAEKAIQDSLNLSNLADLNNEVDNVENAIKGR
jgi:hypothetical protein